jgi:hypothetical protein
MHALGRPSKRSLRHDTFLNVSMLIDTRTWLVLTVKYTTGFKFLQPEINPNFSAESRQVFNPQNTGHRSKFPDDLFQVNIQQ